jgi:hypothetical protein
MQDRHMVSQELVADDVHLALDDLVRPLSEILHRDLLFHAVAVAVRRPLAHSGQVDDRLAQRLRGDRPPVDGDSSELAALDDRHAAPELRALDRRLLAGGPGADDEELEVVVHRVAEH